MSGEYFRSKTLLTGLMGCLNSCGSHRINQVAWMIFLA